MEKLLTIVIPVYNTEKYIRRCLDSLLIQSDLDLLEILVISDGSPDNSSKIIKKYTFQYPSVFRLIEKENGGHGSVINRGISEAKGKYFRVLDSDDWFDLNSFSVFVNQLKDIDASLIITNSIIEHVYKNLQVKEDYHDKLEYGKLKKVDTFDFNTIDGCDLVSLANATFKTQLLKESGVKLYEKCYYEDLQYDLFFLKHVDSFIALDYYIYHYFIGRPEQSVSPQSALNHYEDRLRITLSLVDNVSSIINSEKSVNGKDWLINTLLRHIYVHYKFMLNMDVKKSIYHTKNLNNTIKEENPMVKELLVKHYDYINYTYKCPTFSVCCAKLIYGLKKLL